MCSRMMVYITMQYYAIFKTQILYGMSPGLHWLVYYVNQTNFLIKTLILLYYRCLISSRVVALATNIILFCSFF
ncbi:hypothetical protein GLOIN_2v1719906 [Rhizophagus irregularis DAOM 181602=DAOM 197198]|uniref:Uncharacterized protein n=1 Tax=Rhizophagus irregularis (strain DAOM 181602 / DAOM 197198 / MUCL 43194) TaxID=747089 RepID=A0A2P4P2Z3_RHIID|nr:hypothetical protein GLOIN_2v1719906 [Rhizophagus irregularis DAOM 181602=DAOM 197198]POG59745.1 hypothetical protein GLOIN_2v1719906 [Rhizophagus irregularis DAOM 181602=DAOM 197198]|eukprot:XP_025166611.1 hypothetical protein GLOIN_2v1719906 [Rhizophagus irregularis DAOM 181602=DAOM 197198]